ncbi:MAG: DUF485 domain-containing protein [Verrucomicrobiota bacterium]|nr:DUF485 domain-containing protein [Verrucomicrobiota bacterium]
MNHTNPPDPSNPLTATDWSQIAASPEFQALVAAKRRFIIPATIFFVLYYFALPIMVGYFPRLMEMTVIGHVNLAYLFALSQFFMAWILAYLYVRKSARFDAMAAEIVASQNVTVSPR